MMQESETPITLYTSTFCGHSLLVERLLAKHEVPVTLVNIDGNPEARKELIELNGGFASVPTLLFPDGSKMTEPSLSRLRERLGIEEDSLTSRVRNFFRGSDEEH